MAVLTVGVAYPDPPFNAMPGDTGLDIEVMRALAAKLGDEVTFVGYDGADFDGIFDRLGAGGPVAQPRTGGDGDVQPRARTAPRGP